MAGKRASKKRDNGGISVVRNRLPIPRSRVAVDSGRAKPLLAIKEYSPLFDHNDFWLQDVILHLMNKTYAHANHDQNKGDVVNILVDFDSHTKQLIIKFSDNGKGLDLTKLSIIGHQLQLLPLDPAPIELAQLIFTPGLSTKAQVSTGSGRGVGLSTVKSIMKQHHGEITVNFQDKDSTSPFRPIYFELRLPKA
ncbi:ATP-binding protein [Bacteriovoracaceae bacterium]|nr:ATP-binding protein [Bacteriovoracaceae bacterium]